MNSKIRKTSLVFGARGQFLCIWISSPVPGNTQPGLMKALLMYKSTNRNECLEWFVFLPTITISSNAIEWRSDEGRAR